MSQSHKDVLQALTPIKLGENFDADLEIEGDHLDEIQTDAAALLDEMFPDTTDATDGLIEDWERLLGLPDACAGQPESTEQRLTVLTAKWAERRNLSKDYLIDVADRLGYTITIDNYPMRRFGSAVCGGEYIGKEWGNTITINADGGNVDEQGLSTLACALNRLKPANGFIDIQQTYSDDVRSLLKFNGIDGGTSFLDSSNFASEITPTSVTTEDNRAWFNGVQANLAFSRVTSSAGLGLIQTHRSIDFFIRFNTGTCALFPVIYLSNGDTYTYFRFYIYTIIGGYASDRIRIYWDTATNRIEGNIDYTAPEQIFTDGQWHHVAFINGWEGDIHKAALCIDGIAVSIVDTAYYPYWAWPSTEQWVIGVGPGYGTNPVDVHMDSFRVCYPARWTGEFTPPTLPTY